MNTKYNNWFDSKYYHILYKNRNHKEAKVFIKKLLNDILIDSIIKDFIKVIKKYCDNNDIFYDNKLLNLELFLLILIKFSLVSGL